MAWGKAGSKTLKDETDHLTVSGITPNEFSQSIVHLPRSGNMGEKRTYNNNHTSVYAYRKNFFIVNYICSIAGQEKLSIEFVASTYTAGAGTTPDRAEYVTKFVPSTDVPITMINYENTENGSYDTGSSNVVLGSDITPVEAKQYGVNDNMTFQDDFSPNGWTPLASQIKAYPEENRLHFTGNRVTKESAVYDLGSGNVSDTKWLLRAKFVVRVMSNGGNASGDLMYFGMSDSNQTEAGADAQDFIGFTGIVSSGASAASYCYRVVEALNQTLLTNQPAPFVHKPVVETLYLEIARHSATSYSVTLFSDPSYSVVIEKSSDTCDAGTNGLQYIKCCNYSSGTEQYNQFNGDIYNVEFYNGVDSITRSNLSQVGSRIEETDTRSVYHKDDVGFKLEDGNDPTNYRSASWYEQLSGETP